MIIRGGRGGLKWCQYCQYNGQGTQSRLSVSDDLQDVGILRKLQTKVHSDSNLGPCFLRWLYFSTLWGWIFGCSSLVSRHIRSLWIRQPSCTTLVLTRLNFYTVWKKPSHFSAPSRQRRCPQQIDSEERVQVCELLVSMEIWRVASWVNHPVTAVALFSINCFAALEFGLMRQL